jgi:hypothetical protein
VGSHWLLQQHITHHQWVIWVDADTLFLNQTRRIDDLLEGRDLLLAKDVGGWSFNSGVMGFETRRAMPNCLRASGQRIGEVDDKSSVYSSQGDQYYTNEVLSEEGLSTTDVIVDNLSINTPPCLASDETLLVHFINLDEPYRSVYMASMDAASQRIALARPGCRGLRAGFSSLEDPRRQLVGRGGQEGRRLRGGRTGLPAMPCRPGLH